MKQEVTHKRRKSTILREYEDDPTPTSIHHKRKTSVGTNDSDRNTSPPIPTTTTGTMDANTRTVTGYETNAAVSPSNNGATTDRLRYREYTLNFDVTKDNKNGEGAVYRVGRGRTVVSWKNVVSLSSSRSTTTTTVGNTTAVREGWDATSTIGMRCKETLSIVWYKMVRAMSDLFLPIGYPNSVREGYLSYQFYDSLQGLCSYLRGVVSTSAVLKAAGVGDVEATAMSAAAQWAIKDGFGMIGGLLFSYHASPHFDSHVKEFRLFADLINDMGLTLDMLLPHLPRTYALGTGVLSTLCRAMCGTAAGATKGSITQYFAMEGNVGDLNAKEGTQETLVALLGALGGIVLARYLDDLALGEVGGGGGGGGSGDGEESRRSKALWVSWGVFLFLTLVHVWANYVGVSILRLRSLNRERAEVVLADIVRAGVVEVVTRREGSGGDNPGNPDNNTNNNGLHSIVSYPSPEECNERLIRSTAKLLFRGNVRLGTRLAAALKGTTSVDRYQQVFERLFRGEGYALLIVPTGPSSSSLVVHVLLRVGCTQNDVLKSFLHAMIVRRSLSEEVNGEEKSDGDGDETFTVVERSKRYVDNVFRRGFLSMGRLIEVGWDDKLHLGYGRWRVQWGEEKEE